MEAAAYRRPFFGGTRIKLHMLCSVVDKLDGNTRKTRNIGGGGGGEAK